MKRSSMMMALMFASLITFADPRDYARRISCEMQTASVSSLDTLPLMQGLSPLISADQYRLGRALTADSNVVAILRFSPSLTNALWVSVTNSSVYSNGYIFQLPSLGTNASNWVYTILYEKDAKTYWTGNGRLDIAKSEVAGNPLPWAVPSSTYATTNTVNTSIATHNASGASHPDKVTTNNATYLATVSSASTALQPSATNGWTTSTHLAWILASDTNGWTVTAHDAWITAPSATNIAQSVVAPYTNAIATAWQNPVDSTNFQWSSDGKQITITNYIGAGGAVTIPEMLDGLPVKVIGEYVFLNNTSITSVTGKNVEVLGNSAFNGDWPLVAIDFPKIKTIGNDVFTGAGLTSIDLSNIESIGGFAFASNTHLVSIKYSSANPPSVADTSFDQDIGLTNYVTNPTATGWGATFGGIPVVHLDMYGNVQGNAATATSATIVTGSQSNLVATAVQTELDPTVDGKIVTHNTNLTSHATAMAGKVGTIDAGYLGAVSHTNRTDNPHATTAAQVGALTAQDTTNLVSQASSANFVVRLTAQKTLAYTFAPTNATYIGDCSGSALATNGTISVLAGNVNDYILAWGCTNAMFTTVQGTTVNYEFYCREADTGDQQYKLEIYRRDIATDVMSEWGDGGATFTVPTTATPTLVTGSVYVPSVATNAFRIWARIKRMGGTATNLRTLFVGSGTGTPTFFSMTVPASVAIDAHNADATAHSTLLASKASTSQIPEYVYQGFIVRSNLTGSVTVTNQFEAPVALVGTGAVSVAFSGLRIPAPIYFTAQGFSSITFPEGSYLVGGGMWQTNRVNHFIVWKYSTNLYVNPLISTEIQ